MYMEFLFFTLNIFIFNFYIQLNSLNLSVLSMKDVGFITFLAYKSQ